MNGNSLSCDAMQRVVQAVLGESRQVELLHRGRNRTIFRWRDRDGASLVVKLWNRPDFKGVVRQYLRIDSASHEWRSMVRLHRAGLRVPQPLGRCRVPANAHGFTEAILMEDMGSCTYV
ncbi:MAG: lipopolysaccharide kinase InaA family protein, partial [Burkholderiales bacterium]